MQGNKDRILTTHVGSLPRTLKVLDAMKAEITGLQRSSSGNTAVNGHFFPALFSRHSAAMMFVIRCRKDTETFE